MVVAGPGTRPGLARVIKCERASQLSRTETVSTQRTTMKNIFLLSIVSLAILQPLAEAIFLGPIAVGVALGAIAVGKGLILGSILSQRRTSHRSGRTYTRYNRRTHYSQPRTYYKHYTQPKTVSIVFLNFNISMSNISVLLLL